MRKSVDNRNQETEGPWSWQTTHAQQQALLCSFARDEKLRASYKMSEISSWESWFLLPRVTLPVWSGQVLYKWARMPRDVKWGHCANFQVLPRVLVFRSLEALRLLGFHNTREDGAKISVRNQCSSCTLVVVLCGVESVLSNTQLCLK